MKKLALLSLIIAFACSRAFSDNNTGFPLLGLWRVVSASTANGQTAPSSEEMEFEFRSDGTLFVTALSPSIGMKAPIRMRWHYTFIPPDVVTYTLSGDPTERQRFHLVGDIVTLEHLDYATKGTMKRIKKTQFQQKPVDTQEFPK